MARRIWKKYSLQFEMDSLPYNVVLKRVGIVTGEMGCSHDQIFEISIFTNSSNKGLYTSLSLNTILQYHLTAASLRQQSFSKARGAASV